MADPCAGFHVGIQSGSFRGTKGIERLIRRLRQVEVSCIELHPMHLGPESSELEIAEALALFESAGISVPSFGVIPLAPDAKRCRRVFEFAERLEVEAICADADPGAIEIIERLTEEFDIAVAIHAAGPGERRSSLAAIREAIATRGEGIGICLDTGDLLRAGEDPVEAIRAAPERILGIHLKDVARAESGEWWDVVLGRGLLRVDDLLAALSSFGFDGFIALEYDGDPKTPIPAIRESLRVVRIAAKKIPQAR